MRLDDYERVRSSPARFLVAPSDDHVLADVERVVERRATYFVVEKVGAGAELAWAAAATGGTFAARGSGRVDAR